MLVKKIMLKRDILGSLSSNVLVDEVMVTCSSFSLGIRIGILLILLISRIEYINTGSILSFKTSDTLDVVEIRSSQNHNINFSERR